MDAVSLRAGPAADEACLLPQLLLAAAVLQGTPLTAGPACRPNAAALHHGQL